jgi:hypothetical protein
VSDTDTLLAVTARLTGDQQDAIIDRFTRINRHWRGAQVPDILDALCDGDSNLDQVEPFFEEYPDLPDGAGIAARALIWSGQDLTWDGVLRLLGLMEEDTDG